MWHSAKFALLLAALLFGASGAALGQDEDAPEMDRLLTALSAFVKDCRLTDQDLVKFIELAESFESSVNDSDLGEQVEAAIEAGRPFAEVFLAHPAFKAWTAEKKVDGLPWLKVFLRVQLLLAREEMAGDRSKSDEMFEEMLRDLELEREAMGEEAYALAKKDLEAGRLEQARQTELWLKVAPVATKEEAALLAKHDAGLRKATGRSAGEDDEGTEPGSEDDGEGALAELRREVGAYVGLTRDFRLSEAGLANFVPSATSFRATGGKTMIEAAVAESHRMGKPFGEVLLARADYRTWADQEGVDRQLFIRTLVRLRLIHRAKMDLRSCEEDRSCHQECLSGLEENRAELGEAAYAESRARIEREMKAGEERAAIWQTVPTANQAEEALIEKYADATRAAL